MNRSLAYMPRLDGIRAIAAMAVLVTHFFWRIHALRVAGIGVSLFFVLSGFLITRILIDYRSRMSPANAAKTFYWRRFTRLAPPYYFALLVAAVFGVANMRNDWLWHGLYLSNALFDLRGGVGSIPPQPVGHLWSLSVEEQFYLVWFAVVVWLPRRCLLPAIAAAIVGAPMVRLVLVLWGGHYFAETPAVMDFLGFGALIGWASLSCAPLFQAIARWRVFALSGAAFACSSAMSMPVSQTALGICCASFVALAADPQAKGLDWLSFAPLRDTGKISYGLYLYHLFVLEMAIHFGAMFPGYFIRGVTLIWLTFVVATASWFVIERPALVLGRDRATHARRQAVT